MLKLEYLRFKNYFKYIRLRKLKFENKTRVKLKNIIKLRNLSFKLERVSSKLKNWRITNDGKKI